MGDDEVEIVLERASEVAPPARPEPAQDRNLVLASMGKPQAGAVGVYVHAAALQGIEDHARSSMSAEVGGVLLGRVYAAPSRTWVDITGFLPAQMADEGRMHLTFTHDTWAEINAQKDAQYPEDQIVGWYHTHPGLTVFLSDMDRFIHRNFFSGSSFVALVCDPVNNRRAFFEWRGEGLAEAPGYTLYAERANHQALTQLERRLKAPAPPRQMATAMGTSQPVNVTVRFNEPAINLYHVVPPGARKGLGMDNEQTAPRLSIKSLIIVGLLALAAYLWAFPRETHLQMAKALDRAGFYEDAATEYHKHLALRPNDLPTLKLYIMNRAKQARLPLEWEVDQGYGKLLWLTEPGKRGKPAYSVEEVKKAVQQLLPYYPPSDALKACLGAWLHEEGAEPTEADVNEVGRWLPDAIKLAIRQQIQLRSEEAEASSGDSQPDAADEEKPSTPEDHAKTDDKSDQVTEPGPANQPVEPEPVKAPKPGSKPAPKPKPAGADR